MTVASLFIVSVCESSLLFARRGGIKLFGKQKGCRVACHQTITGCIAEWGRAQTLKPDNLGLNPCSDTRCVTLSKILNFSGLQFSICKIGIIITSSSQNYCED